VEKIFGYVVVLFLKFALWLRYRIKIKGLENITPEKLNRPGGILFMPNHPTFFIDPIIISLALRRKFAARPLIVEFMYYLPLFHGVMQLINALPVPDFVNSSNSLKKKKGDKVIQTVIDGIKEKQNFLVYPSGKSKSTAYESIGGASAAHRIIQDAPETNIVLVRIKGLWGSSFSRAISDPADLTNDLWHAFKVILKNLIFFLPRREVIVEFEPAPIDFPRAGTRIEVNKYLESWYNKPDGLTKQVGKLPGDSMILLSYSRWSNELLPLVAMRPSPDRDIPITSIPKEIQDKVINKLVELHPCKPDSIKPEMNLSTDVGLDSLDLAEVSAFLQDQFDVKGVHANQLTTVSKVMAIAAGQIVCEETPEEENVDLSKWLLPVPKNRVQIAPGETIAEVFLNQCQRAGNTIACADARSGVLTYSQMKLRAILIAERLRKLPGDYIGIMLPASVAANLLILACQLAGKVPLMVNWTVGPRHLESVAQLSKVQVVISSWAFVDRLENVDLTGVDEMLLMLEDVVREISLKDKLTAYIRSKQSNRTILKTFGVDKRGKDCPAVLLFTSGTESMPKGVPLSQNNILSDLRAALAAVEIYSDDIIYGILPPFHSFGFTVSGILGLLAGTRIVYSPDPMEGQRLANGFARWKVTIMCGAPTFIKGMLKVATADQMQTMRLCVTGAEKAPPELFSVLTNYGKPNCVIEGYGITECAPVLTLNPIGSGSKGVGKALPGIELRIVRPDTEVALPIGQQGLILAKGPNVFNGYLNPSTNSPFTMIDGERWYKTGDLGYLDENGFLNLAGRMKRFVKMGGEMVSLASVEDALLEMGLQKGWPTNQEGPSFAICSKEVDGEKTRLFLFSQFDIGVDDVNVALKESGFSNLVKVSSVIKLKELPIMGTGKINYRQLEGEYLKS